MQPGQRVILFAHPRSGSSSLLQILQLHPQLHLLEEPFNEGFVGWSPTNKDYLGQIHDIPSFQAQLADIFTTYNGLKMLDYQLSDDLISHIFEREEYLILFLRRKNLLQAVVSVLLAHQTQLWKKWDMTKPLTDYYQHLQRLDIAEVQQRVRELDEHLRLCEAIIDQRQAGIYLKLTYEGLYYASPAAQAEQLAAIWRLLALPSLEGERVHYYLSPEDVKVNSAATYAFLPNAREIQEQCGNDRTGWLYE